MATQLQDEASIEKIISEMTLEEKVACITGGSSFATRPFEKYGIPSMLMVDGGTGINTSHLTWEEVYQEYAEKLEKAGTPLDKETCTGRMGGMEIVINDPELFQERNRRYQSKMKHPKPYGCYPSGMALAATWNPDVIEACGREVGAEASREGIDILLGSPNVNIHRDPRNGRLFEGYSEDPCLTAKLAPSFVKGVQSQGVIANVKHFAANNQETDRMGIDEKIPQRALREIYLPGFKACVEAGCKTVMSAYNRINGIPCAQNSWLLQTILREEWGFDGFVMTDWSGAYDQVEACDAGNDLVMPGPRQTGTVICAVREGRLSEERVNNCVRNILRIALQAPVIRGRKTDIDLASGSIAAYRAAAESITLLKNKGVLPLKPEAHVAVFGTRSRDLRTCGGGSAYVVTSRNTQISDCLQESLGADQVSFEYITEKTSVVLVTLGARGQEGADRPDMQIDAEDHAALKEARCAAAERKLPLVVLLNVAAPVEILEWEAEASAILCLYLPGMQGARAAVDILMGKINPSGKLPITFPKTCRDCPSYGNFPGYNSEVWYGEGIYVGYRHYDKRGIQPMYPFGHGLSYTSFALTHASAPKQVNVDTDAVRVQVAVKNTGDVAGAQTVQLYVHDKIATLDKPHKELKAFAKVFLEPGEEQRVELVLEKQDFSSYDTRLEQWAVEPGEFELLLGFSSAEIVKTLSIDVTCRNPYGIGPKTDIVKVVSNPEAANAVKTVIGVDLRSLANVYTIFQPLTPFEQVWNDRIVPELGVDEKKANEMFHEICRMWDAL